jgi:hypothetical protein
MPDQITGTVEIIVALADEASVEPQALVDLVSTWARAVEIGFFGPGRIQLQGSVEIHGRQVSGTFECGQLSQTAFHVLAKMVRYFSKMKGKVKTFNVFQNGQRVAAGRAAIPALPQAIPFAVEYPEDLKRCVWRLSFVSHSRQANETPFSLRCPSGT